MSEDSTALDRRLPVPRKQRGAGIFTVTDGRRMVTEGAAGAGVCAGGCAGGCAWASTTGAVGAACGWGGATTWLAIAGGALTEGRYDAGWPGL